MTSPQTQIFIDSLANVSTQLQTLEAELKTRSQGVLKESFSEFFKACPDITGFGWTQYTPYFNDGDECTFRINSFTFTKNKEIIFDEISDPYELEDEDGYAVYKHRHNVEDCNTDEYQACLAIEEFVNQLEDICKTVFGNHASVIITPTQIYISEYEHD